MIGARSYFVCPTPLYKSRQQYSNNLRRNRQNIVVKASLKALIFDCDGVIIESEGIHRQAYNDAFENFNIQCGDGNNVNWSIDFYDDLQNKVGGGKPKMRWYFGENGWPTSTILPHVPETDEDKAILIDTLQDWKSIRYQDIVGSGTVAARPGVFRLINEARQAGLKVVKNSVKTYCSTMYCIFPFKRPPSHLQNLGCFEEFLFSTREYAHGFSHQIILERALNGAGLFLGLGRLNGYYPNA